MTIKSQIKMRISSLLRFMMKITVGNKNMITNRTASLTQLRQINICKDNNFISTIKIVKDKDLNKLTQDQTYVSQ